MNLWELQQQYQKQMERGEQAVVNRLIVSYGAIWKHAKSDLDKVLAQIAEARARGEPITPGWLYREERARALMQQVRDEITRWSKNDAARAALELQRHGIESGAAEARGLLERATRGVDVSFTAMPRGAVERMVGFTESGMPLSDLFDKIGPEVGERFKNALIVGIGTGMHPTRVAQLAREATGVGLARALRIARTEMLRGWRESSRQTYAANDDIVDGWIWSADLSDRTCASCLAMHGTFHKLDERLDDHPNGRCAMLPHTKTWSELGFKGIQDTRPAVADSAEWLNKLDEKNPSAVNRILGMQAAELWRAGKVGLHEFTQQRTDATWGTMRSQASLRAIMDAKEKRWRDFPADASGARSFLENVGYTPLWDGHTSVVQSDKFRGQWDSSEKKMQFAKDVQRELERIDLSGKTKSDLSGLRTVLHEGLHSASQASWTNKTRVNDKTLWVEEVGVEWLARVRLKQIAPDLGVPYSPPKTLGYVGEVARFEGVLKRHGLNEKQITDILERGLRVPLEHRRKFWYNEIADELGLSAQTVRRKLQVVLYEPKTKTSR